MERTVEHDVIRRWVEEREGAPSVIRDGRDALHVDFGEAMDNLVPLSWEEFFRIFETQELAFRYEDEMADGEQSLAYSFAPRDARDDEAAEEEVLAEDDAEEGAEEEEFAGMETEI